jgi:hypothetical protein
VFHSNLELILDAGTGVFISLNSAGQGRAVSIIRRGFMLRFMDRYFPAPKAAPLPTLKSALDDGRKVAGAYVVSRRGDSSFTRFLAMLQPLNVSVAADGTLIVPPLVDAAGNLKHWREIKPFVWQEVNGKSLVQASWRDGHVDQIGTDDIGPIIVLQPAGFTQALWNLILLAASLAILVLAVLFWPIKAVLRWRYDRPLMLTGRARLLYRLARVDALLDAIFLAGFPLAFLLIAMSLASWSPRIDWVFRILQLIGIAGVVGTVAPVWNFVIGLRDATRPWWTKVTDLLLALACLSTIWFAFSQNLLTLGLKY